MEQFKFKSRKARAEYYASQANKFLDDCDIYGNAEDRKGLITNVKNSMVAKKWIEDLFKNHPAYNGKGQIVLPMEVERPIDTDIIADYSDYIYFLSRRCFNVPAVIDGYTYYEADKEREELGRYMNAIYHMRLQDEDVTIKGEPFSVYRDKYNALSTLCEKFQVSTEYAYMADGNYILSKNKANIKKVEVLSDAIRNCVGKTLENERDIERLLEAFPCCQARCGIKITKVLQKALKEIGLYDWAMENEQETYNKRFSQWCDAISPLTVRKWSVISINFVDYLTMSHGNNWTSCLNVDKHGLLTDGMYCDGFNSRRTLDYALDPSTIVFYTVDENYDGNDFELQPKCTRQLFHFGEGKLIQARLYPQDDVARRNIYDQYREVMEKVLADCMKDANLWSSPTRGLIEPNGKVFTIPYDDSGSYIDFSEWACHGGDERDFQKEVNYVVYRGSKNAEENGIPMQVGSLDAVCIMCGEPMSEDYTDAISCDNCY